MDNNMEMTEQLIRYLDQELAYDQRLALEQKLATDPLLANELQSLLVAREAVNTAGLYRKIHSVREDMLREENTNQLPDVSDTPVRRIPNWGLRVAAAVIIVVFAAGLYQYFTLSSEKVFRDGYQIYQLSTSRGAELNSIAAAYQEKNYAKAIQLFESGNDLSASANFFAGCSFLQSGNAAKAINCFTHVQQINQTASVSSFEEDAAYYLSLAYLANNQPSNALPLLETIHQNPDHAYHDKVSNWELMKVRWLARK